MRVDTWKVLQLVWRQASRVSPQSSVNGFVVEKTRLRSEESWVRDRGFSEACLFTPKGSFHLLLLITLVLATTRRDLVAATEKGPYLVRAVHSL
jgi:hypothetical protein